MPRKRTPAKPKVEDNEDRIQTIAEQKMNKSLKKIQKSKIPKWNPNDWQIDDGKARVRIKGRHWDDVSVPRWVQNCDTDRSENRKTVLKCCFLCNFFSPILDAGGGWPSVSRQETPECRGGRGMRVWVTLATRVSSRGYCRRPGQSS